MIRSIFVRVLTAAVTVLLADAGPAPAGAVTVPLGFQDQPVAGNLDQPAVLVFAPDGRLFVGEKASGKIRVVKDGALLPAPFADISQSVPAGTQLDSFNERGLLGIAFHPQFASNGLVYVYYTLCKQPVSGNLCTAGQSKNRIVRLHAAGDVTDTADPVLVLDGIDSDAGNHNAGWIDFSPADEKLYVATGDGGQVHEKSQNLASLSGKILRLEADGSVPPDNPYAGSPTARGEVWASGLRNPWRCRFRSDGRLLCGDVGQDTWEEIDVIFPANDYGWPTTQDGPFTLAQYPSFTPPIFAYHHNGSAAIMGGDFGERTTFPGDYQESWFFGDYAQGIIRRVILDATATAVVGEAVDFASGLGSNSVTDIVAGPVDGALYYTHIANGEVRKIFLVPGNHSPSAVAGATNASGPPPLTVTFSSAGSVDDDGDPLTFSWDFGDGTPPVAGASPSHEYQTRGSYTATLTVSDGKPSPGPGTATVAVTVGTPPMVTIAQPLDGTAFDAGEQFLLVGSALDAEDGTIAAAALDWKVVFHHADHTHPFVNRVTTTPRRFTTANIGETSPDVGYEIIATATDSDGLTGSATVLLVPNTAPLMFETTPAGFSVTLDGTQHTTPFAVTSVVGMKRSVGVPAQGGYVFSSWSDGGTQAHTITVPADPTTLIAVLASPTPTASPTPVGLPDPAAGRAADGCQRTITAGALAITRTALGGLGRCTNAVQVCAQSRAGDPGCLAKARTACIGALDDVAGAAAKMQTAIVHRCPSTADVMATLGLGYADVAGDCTLHGDTADDVPGLAACIAKRSRCAAERAFDLATPRAGELLRVAAVPIPAGACLADRGGSGGGVTALASKAVTKCVVAIAKSASAFLAGRAGAFGGCASKVFRCAQRKSLSDTLPACIARANAACTRAADSTRAAAKLRRAIDRRCGEALIPYATLRAPTAAFVDGVVADCAAEGIADVGSLAAFETCLVHQHECRAIELVGTAVPRLPQLLDMVGGTLGPTDCPIANGIDPQ